MIYREHSFLVVQTASPAGWTWTVQLAGNGSKTGNTHRRETAILAAWSAIDKVFNTAERSEIVAHGIVDGRLFQKSATSSNAALPSPDLAGEPSTT